MYPGVYVNATLHRICMRFGAHSISILPFSKQVGDLDGEK